MRDRHFNRRDFGNFPEQWQKHQEHRQRNRMFFGLMMALAGIVLLLKTMGIIPHFTFSISWPIFLILIGLFSGIKHSFRNNAWWILALIGAANLVPQFMIMGQPSSHFVWPGFIILIGLAIAFRPRKPRCLPGGMGGKNVNHNINNESMLNIDVTFGGRKEIVTSKDFKGGNVNVTFAGCEINLAQADMTEQSIVMDLRVSFGSVEMVVPSHWEVKNEIDPSFGSVEDGRIMQTATSNETKKTLILRGNCSFGSVELKSY